MASDSWVCDTQSPFRPDLPSEGPECSAQRAPLAAKLQDSCEWDDGSALSSGFFLDVSELLINMAVLRALLWVGAGAGGILEALTFQEPHGGGRISVPPFSHLCPQPYSFLNCSQHMIYWCNCTSDLRKLHSFPQFIWWYSISLQGDRGQDLGPQERK